MQIRSVKYFMWSPNFFLDFNFLHRNEFLVFRFWKGNLRWNGAAVPNSDFPLSLISFVKHIWEYYGAGQLEIDSSINYD